MIRRMSDDATITIDDIRDFFALVLAKNPAALDLINAAQEDLQLLPQGFVFSPAGAVRAARSRAKPGLS
jgi:hypothetical protein